MKLKKKVSKKQSDEAASPVEKKGLMHHIAEFIVNRRIIITIVFAVITIVSAVGIFFVKVNYNDVKYLPNDSSVKTGLGKMYEDFGENGNGSLMLTDVTVAEVIAIKNQIEAVDGVDSVIWLNDIVSRILGEIFSVYEPFVMTVDGVETETVLTEAEAITFLLDVFYAIPDDAQAVGDLNVADFAKLLFEGTPDQQVKMGAFLGKFLNKMTSGELALDISMVGEFRPQLETFYKKDQKAAFLQIMFTEGDYSEKTVEAIGAIKALGFEAPMTGNAITTYNSINLISKETNTAMIFAIVVILLILFLTTSSFWEPVLFLIAIGVAVLINMGSNFLLGEISYLTKGVSSVLQLALNVNYSIFLMNRYKRERKNGLGVEDAMKTALKKSIAPISASSLTTIVSFIALMFMRFKIGLDIGIVLAKGTLISLITVYLLMPALVIFTHKLLEKSEHKTFNFTFKKLSKFLLKTRFYLPFIIIALIVPTAYFQTQNTFTHSGEASLEGKGTIGQEEREKIEAVFGRQNQILVILPTEYYDLEEEISLELIGMQEEGILSVQSSSLIRNSGFDSMLPASFFDQFEGNEKYTRIIAMSSVSSEGEDAKLLVDKINLMLEEKLSQRVTEEGKEYYLIGSVPATFEIKEIVENDYNIVTYVSIGLIALVLLFIFKSAILPVIMLVIIQFSVYVNMTVPYLMNEPVVFIGYLLVSCILLGSTIDFAVLITNHYMENRQTMNRFDAAQHSMAYSSRALITSAGILTLAGFTMGLFTTLPATKLFGMAIGRGGILAFVMVLLLLPQLLMLLDKPIRLTTYKGKQRMIDNRLAERAEEIDYNVKDKQI